MKSGSTKKVLLAALLAFLAPLIVAAGDDFPVSNWTVPMYSLDGLGKAVDATDPRAFSGVQPCRVTDTRGNGAPIQGGAFTGGADVRNWDIDGICGIPTGVDAVSVNFTVVGPAASGFLVSWPTGGPVPPVSILNFTAGETVANAAIVPVSAGGSITVNVSAATHVLMDVNGYFSNSLFDPQRVFRIDNNSTVATIIAVNSSTTCSGACGIEGYTSSNSGGYAIYGNATAVTGAQIGVWGEANSPNDFTSGVLGNSDAAVGRVFGVIGDNDSDAGCSGGVWGRSGLNTFPCVVNGAVGVLGSSNQGSFGKGVAGYGSQQGVTGLRINFTTGAIATRGYLGFTGASGVHSDQDVTAGGAKPFVVPYDGDPTKQIMFIAAEADEAVVFTRGRVKLERGLATIKVPDHFLKVAEPEGWSVQLTPIGDMATLAVMRMDTTSGEIVVKGSRNVSAFYRIEAVRAGYAGFQPVQDNLYFVPESGASRMDNWPERTKEILIRNKIYDADGMPNMETAEKLGWKAKWDKAEAEYKARAKAEAEQEENGNYTGKEK
jgi:hypothetical protein